jgi:DNA repair protein RadC
MSKACTVIAMLELGRRYWDTSGKKINTPQDIFALVRHYANRKQERFLSVSLNGAHEVIAVRVVTVGLVNRTIVHPREVFADPLSDRCSAICICHNHPSGDLKPSMEDDDVTASLETAASILGIRFLDHLIFSEFSFFSYRKANKLKNRETISAI